VRTSQEITVDGSISGDAFEVLQLRLKGQGDAVKEEIKQTLVRAALRAEKILEAEVPHGETHALANSIRMSPLKYSPGGAGGGGFWEIEVSVGEGVPYVQNVVEGTGIFGPRAFPIYPKNPKGVMAFSKNGEFVFTKWVRGQEPDDLWIVHAQDAAQEEVDEGLRRIDAIHKG